MKYFYLSHWKDATEVRIDSNLMQRMKNHHFMGVRFLYNAYKKKFKGVILNHDQGMNFPLILEIFLTATFRQSVIKAPVLILTSENGIYVWHYHMKQIGVNVVLLKDKDCKHVFEDDDASIILASLNDLSIVHPYRNNKFEFVIVDKFDTVAHKMTFKRLSGNFNIALTNKDFTEDRDQKLLWTMLNWTNPHMFGKLADFYKKDKDHLQNLRDPYDEVWHRLSWDFCESFTKDTEEELQTYKKTIDDWTASNKIKTPQTSPQQKPRKRRLQDSGKNSKGSSKKVQNPLSLTVVESQQAIVMAETQNKKNLTCFCNNYPEQVIRKNVSTENQVLKFVSKANKIKNIVESTETVKSNICEQTFTETLTNSPENNNENLESVTYRKPKNLRQNCYNNNKEMENSPLHKTKMQTALLYNTHNEDKISRLPSQALEKINSTFSENDPPQTENIDEDVEIDENPLLTAVIKGSSLKDLASQLIENPKTKTSSVTEESDILLSIIDGTFSASQAENTIDSSDDQNDAVEVSNCKSSKTILMFDDNNVENLETPKRKHEFTESVNLNLRNSPMDVLNDCLPPLKCASEDYILTKFLNESETNISGPGKSNYKDHIFESLFGIDEDICDFKMLTDAYKLSNQQRNALITSLFED